MNININAYTLQRFNTKLLLISLIVILCNNVITAQKDSLPPATMTSKRLITLDDFSPEASYGRSYMEMMNPNYDKTNRKTIFNQQYSKFILPTVFIAYGVSARFNQLPIRQFDFDIDHEVLKHIDRNYNIDDYFEYGMPVIAYGLGFIPGVKARNNHLDRTLAMVASTLIMKGSVELMKNAIPVSRPHGDMRSFPSGHTAVTMMSAHIMFKEYRDVSPWICAGGYLMATTTGVLRITNRAHWFSDVIMGAGIGLLSVEIGYMLLPVWHKILGIESSEQCFVAVPMVDTKGLGLGFVYRF